MTQESTAGPSVEEIERDVREYVLREFLPGERPDALTPDTPLLSDGILDSIATVKLVAYLEDRYGVSFQAHEMGAEHLDTTERTARLIAAKLARR